MSKKVVLDASAVLALLNQEEGAQIVENHLTESMISTVNLSEVMTVLIDIGMPHNEIEEYLDDLQIEVVNFSSVHASEAAKLRTNTKKIGLSFGDRACLALAKEEGLMVLTSDTAWKKIQSDISIKLIR